MAAVCRCGADADADVDADADADAMRNATQQLLGEAATGGRAFGFGWDREEGYSRVDVIEISPCFVPARVGV